MVSKEFGEVSLNRVLRQVKLNCLINHVSKKVRPKLGAWPPAKLGARPERMRQSKANTAGSTPMESEAIFHHPLLQTIPAEEKVVDDQSCDIEMAMSLLSTLGAKWLVRTF